MPSDKKYTGISEPKILEERVVMPSTFETIDSAVLELIDEGFNVFCTTNEGWKKVPVIWMTAERAFQVKNNQNLRDSTDSIVLPVMTIERTSMDKNPDKKGIFQGHVPPTFDKQGGSITVARRINQDKTSKYANANAYDKRGQINFPKGNKRVVYHTLSIPMPVYVEINYSIVLQSEYQQQMNEMLTPFITKTGMNRDTVIKKDGHRYEAFIQQNFAQENNNANLEQAERTYKTKIDIKVLGYLIGEDKNQEQPKIVVRENAVEYKIPRERFATKDELAHLGDEGFYRES
tara:strand:- start:16563 stop:17432 length:870 start_codon:yes stop_codon:yes gene_type:complete